MFNLPDASLSQQAAAIPFRRSGEALDICVIRKKHSGRWGIPKGLVDPGDTLEETALNETWEEAGLKGQLIGSSIGNYRYRKWGVSLLVEVYLIEVVEQCDTWLEVRFRERRWTSFAQATLLLSRHPVHPLLERVPRILGHV
jgi:phosphohistidine phosphatase